MCRQLTLVDLLNPRIPLWLELLLHELCLVLLGDARILDTVHGELFEVADVQLPGAHGIQVVERDALVAEEAWVVRAN